jgi:hypothetical protein
VKTFKFFQKGNNPTTTQLRRYHKRLLSRYTYKFNLYPGQTNYNAGGLIFYTVLDFINGEQLTSYNEVRSYYKVAYQHLNHGEDIITDEDHEDLVRAVEYITQPIPIGDLMGELINGIQVLDEQVRNMEVE